LPIVKVRSQETPLVMSWLAGELETEIPNLDIFGSERKLLDFAYHDLETCLIQKLSDTEFSSLEETLCDESRYDEIKAFLKYWTKQWLEKWRDRVTLCQKMPSFSLEYLKTKKKATKIFKQMKDGPELKKMIVQQLINKGEICMADLIAESFIIEEIAFRMRIDGRKMLTDSKVLEPLDLLQQVSGRVKSLAERKTPIIHLKLLSDV
jgi:hypothetical protein